MKKIDDLETFLNSPRHYFAIQYALHVLYTSYSDAIDDVILYGSCARREQKYDSDVDLLIILKPEAEVRPHRIRTEVDSAKLDIPEVDSHFYRKSVDENLKTQPNNCYWNEIRRDGISIWQND